MPQMEANVTLSHISFTFQMLQFFTESFIFLPFSSISSKNVWKMLQNLWKMFLFSTKTAKNVPKSPKIRPKWPIFGQFRAILGCFNHFSGQLAAVTSDIAAITGLRAAKSSSKWPILAQIAGQSGNLNQKPTIFTWNRFKMGPYTRKLQ